VKLYTYFRSTASYRVRIALNLKAVDCEHVPVHLLRDGGEQRGAEYLARNPQGLVPALEDEGLVVGQSLAIIEYLDEKYPEPPLLPRDAARRAQVRALAALIACEVHPLNNLRVLQYLRGELKCDEDAVNAWYRHWVALGLGAYERSICSSSNGRYSIGDAVSMADLYLVPQMFNARRFDCDLSGYPTLLRIDKHLCTWPAFADAAPERQADAT
jgi:maleylacetoacetate isomerase